MLLEQITYHNDLPFSICFSNVAQENPHYHKEMEMTLLLRGSASYRIHHQDYSLAAGDVLVVDTEDLHRIYDSSEDVLMLTMHVNLEYFNDLYPNIDFMIFACEECGKESAARHQELQNKVSLLRHHLAEIMMLCAADGNDEQLLEKIHQFIFTMVNQFQGFFIEDNQFRTNKDEINSIDLNRLYRIIKYIYINYDKKITLDDLAQLEYLSPYYISHLIKETSGLSFQNFLNYVRVEYAEKFLVKNKLTLTQISEFCGFSSLSYFNKCFQTWHRQTPAQYRKQLRPCQRVSHSPFSQEDAFSLLRPYLNTYRTVQKNKKASEQSSHHIFIPIKANYTEGKDFHRQYPLHIFANSASEILRLGAYAGKLMELNPASIKISETALKAIPYGRQVLSDLRALGVYAQVCGKTSNVRKAAVNTVAEAFSVLQKAPAAGLRLLGSQGSLFTEDGLPAPYYTLYQLFSGIDGVIVEAREQYLIIKNNSTIYLMLFQTETKFKRNAHIQFHDLRGNHTVVQRIFTREHSAAFALKALNRPDEIDERLKPHIFHAVSGATQFTHLKGSAEPKLDLTIEPGMFLLLEIRAPKES